MYGSYLYVALAGRVRKQKVRASKVVLIVSYDCFILTFQVSCTFKFRTLGVLTPTTEGYHPQLQPTLTK